MKNLQCFSQLFSVQNVNCQCQQSTGGNSAQVSGQYKCGYRNSIVVMRALKMIENGHTVLTRDNWKQCCTKEHYRSCKSSIEVVYCNLLADIHAHLQKMRLGSVNRCCVILVYDNPKSHVGRMTQQKLKESWYEILSHPPYSPNFISTHYPF